MIPASAPDCPKGIFSSSSEAKLRFRRPANASEIRLPGQPRVIGRTLGAALWVLSTSSIPLGYAGEQRETFSTDPFASNTPAWSVTGDPDLFRWNSDSHQLEVTWDSSRSNSFCVWPLERKLSASDAFSFGWTLTLRDAGARDPIRRTNVLQVSIALVQQARLPDGYPLRTKAGRAKDLLDFSFFPLADYGPFGRAAYISPVAFGENTAGYSFGNPYDLADGVPHPILCTWDPADRRMRTTVEGVESVAPTDPPLPVTDNFNVDAFAIVVWNETLTPSDSLIAHGAIDDVVIHLPDPPVRLLRFEFSTRTVRFDTQTSFRYQLEASGDLVHWNSTGISVLGSGAELAIRDSREALFLEQFYRIRAIPSP